MKRLIIGITALMVGLTGCSATGGAPAVATERQDTAARADRYAAADQIPDPVLPVKYFLGDTVQNGSLRFTVNSTRRAARIYDQFGGYYNTTGEYVIVKLTVQNLDTNPVFFYYDSQTLDLHGQQVSTDSAATGALNPACQGELSPLVHSKSA
jgi:hypothetical protein